MLDSELGSLGVIVETGSCKPCSGNAFDPEDELDELVAIVEAVTCGPSTARLVILSIQPTGGGQLCRPGGNNFWPTRRE